MNGTNFSCRAVAEALHRLCQAGKAKKLALTACMRKLLTILSAMVKSGTLWRHRAELVHVEG